MGDLTQEQFDRLLFWLDPDRDAAALKYAKIQLRLIKFFVCRGCSEPESLADITIDRVASKVEWLIANYVGDRALYFFGVAHNVHKEYLRKKPQPDFPPPWRDPDEFEEREREFDCLEGCMKRLAPENASLVIRYYEGEKQTKITNRMGLAKELSITLDALRIRAHRIRRELRKCVIQCLSEAPVH